MIDIHRKLAFVGFVLVLLIAAGCSLFSKPDYFPMTLNDVWKYGVTKQVTRWWGPGQPPFPTTESAGAQVVLDTTLFGKSALKVLNTNDTVTTVNYVVRTAAEVLIYGPDPADSPPQTGLKLPLAENSSWTADTNPRQGIMVCTVKAREEVSVPAGTFSDAWLVETVGDSNPDLPQRRWFAKDVGMVKLVRTNRQVFGPETMETRVIQELKSYTVH